MDSYIKLLWKYYKDNNDIPSRDRLISHYVPFLKKIAKTIYSNLPNTIQLSEVESYANIGLLDALEKYNYERGVEFETYAKIRIKGAVYDEIRKQDWLPRSIRSALKKQQNIISNGGEMKQVSEGICSLDDSVFLSFNNIAVGSTTISSLDLYQDSQTGGLDIEASDFVEELEKRISIQKLLMKLKNIDRKVIFLYYFEGRTFKEIGEMLNLTESRISQIHKKALAFLKQVIGDFYF